MRKISSLVLLLGFFFAQSQEVKRPLKNNKVFIGFNFSPDYCYRSLINGSGSSGWLIKARNDIEVAKFGYTTGLNIGIGLPGRIGFEAGVQYSNKGYRTKMQDLIFQQPDPSDPERAKFIYTWKYIDIPFRFTYTSQKGKARFVGSAGIAANFLLQSTQIVVLEFSDGKTERQNDEPGIDFKKFNLSPFVSAGIRLAFKNNFFLRLEPTFRYGLLKINDQPIPERLWNTGLNAGIYYKLK